MQIKTEHGIIGISNEVISAVAGLAASSCFGVKGMTATSVKDGEISNRPDITTEFSKQDHQAYKLTEEDQEKFN